MINTLLKRSKKGVGYMLLGCVPFVGIVPNTYAESRASFESFLESTIQKEKTVKGQIKDENGEALPGATIMVKGTTTGTVTDFDGNYSITLPEGASVLVISFVGYANQEIAVNGRSVLDFSMSADANQLDEVVVVGYGVQKKSDLSGAISSVKADAVNKIAATSPTQMLQGRTAGVTVISGGAPGSTPSLKIRGIGSLGSTTPLYVIDGIPGGDIGMLSPDEIESFEILKDGAAAAIYGSQAANGVVLITTKSGKKGQPLKIDVNVKGGIQRDYNRMPLANAEEWTKVQKGLDPDFDVDLSKYANTDWQDEVLRDATFQNYSVGITGGSENVGYSFNTSYMNQEGVIRETGTERYNFRFKANIEKGKLKILPNISYSRQSWDWNTMSLSNLLNANPLTTVYNDSLPNGFGYLDQDIDPVNSAANPLGQIKLYTDKRVKDQLTANLGLRYEIIEGLNFAANFGYIRSIFNKKTSNVWNQIEKTKINQARLYDRRSTWDIINTDATLSYNKTIAEKHQIGLMAGIVTYYYDYERMSQLNEGGFLYSDFAGLEPSFDIAKGSDSFAGTGYPEEIFRLGMISRFNYTYDNKYLVQATFRRDASSKFGSKNRLGNFPSASVAWKIQEEEFFKPLKSIISELKPRFSYGILGRETNLDPYQFQALVSTGYYGVWGDKSVPGIGINSTANNDLVFEKSITMNIGLDFALLNDQLYGTFNYYENNSESILLQDPTVAPSNGLFNQTGGNTAPTVNLGEIENTGIELELGYRGKSGDFSYDLSGNLTTINNKVTDIGRDETGFLSGSYGARTIKGKSIAQFFMYKADGIFQNQAEIDAHVAQPNAVPGDVRYVDADGNGEIGDGDRVDVGSPIADFEYGFNVNLGYKGIDLSMFFQGVSGNKIFNETKFQTEKYSTYNFSSNLVNSWTPENPNNEVPRLTTTRNDQNGNYSKRSDRFLEDGSYFRLKNIQLGYTLPKSLLSKINIDNLRVYISADNVFTVTNYSGVDPEVPQLDSDDVLTQGVDYTLYPRYRTFTVGAQLRF